MIKIFFIKNKKHRTSGTSLNHPSSLGKWHWDGSEAASVHSGWAVPGGGSAIFWGFLALCPEKPVREMAAPPSPLRPRAPVVLTAVPGGPEQLPVRTPNLL